MGIDSTVRVQYTCDLCGVKDREVNVRAREGESVVEWWLDATMRDCIQPDHLRLSPGCSARSLTNVKIFIGPGVDKVGGATRQ